MALLFGSEKTGLTNDQLSHASLLTTIPMYSPSDARHLSMNLGQSVAVCLYELTRSGFENSIGIPVIHEALATAEDRERGDNIPWRPDVRYDGDIADTAAVLAWIQTLPPEHTAP